jgi:2-amino-4-hydroxy-6-hydroxymethyldihydropteridine diphosphokinase
MTTPNSSAVVYISLGSNIEPESNLTHAVQLLQPHGQVQRVSSAYITPPQGFTQQADFWNAAVMFKTGLTPLTLKHDVLDFIEQTSGRVRDPNNKNAPRTIDLDISLWNNEVFEYGEKPWRVPDADILRFAHVAIPLAEIAPHYIHPQENLTLSQIAARFDSDQLRFQRKAFWYDT